VALCALGVLLPACSREDARPKEVVLGRAGTPVAGSAEGAQAKAAPSDEPWAGDVPAAQGPQPFRTTVLRTVTVEAGAPAKVNPDDAVLERARVAAGGCFSSLAATAGSPPERSAHIVFNVIPTGTVSTADVSSGDTTDDRVLDCIHQRALSTTFSDNGGGPLRTYEIDVRVIARGSAGGR
jgi:hypothetical protein